MASRRNRSSRRKGIKKVVSNVASTGEKGVSGIFNFLSKGFNVGAKEVKSGVSMVSRRRRSRSRKNRKSRRR